MLWRQTFTTQIGQTPMDWPGHGKNSITGYHQTWLVTNMAGDKHGWWQTWLVSNMAGKSRIQPIHGGLKGIFETFVQRSMDSWLLSSTRHVTSCHLHYPRRSPKDVDSWDTWTLQTLLLKLQRCQIIIKKTKSQVARISWPVIFQSISLWKSPFPAHADRSSHCTTCPKHHEKAPEEQDGWAFATSNDTAWGTRHSKPQIAFSGNGSRENRSGFGVTSISPIGTGIVQEVHQAFSVFQLCQGTKAAILFHNAEPPEVGEDVALRRCGGPNPDRITTAVATMQPQGLTRVQASKNLKYCSCSGKVCLKTSWSILINANHHVL